jgi:hypothetical protein
MNEQNKTVAKLWDGCNLKCIFRRCVDAMLFNLWEEVLGIASTINLSPKEEEPIWQFHSSGVYSAHSLYKVVNFKDVVPIFVPKCVEAYYST